MNELLKCWLYLNAARNEYYYISNIHDDTNTRTEKIQSYITVARDFFQNTSDEILKKYKGRSVRHINDIIGTIEFMYAYTPIISVITEYGELLSLNINDLELI